MCITILCTRTTESFKHVSTFIAHIFGQFMAFPSKLLCNFNPFPRDSVALEKNCFLFTTYFYFFDLMIRMSLLILTTTIP
jgi:hypothetical protein